MDFGVDRINGSLRVYVLRNFKCETMHVKVNK